MRRQILIVNRSWNYDLPCLPKVGPQAWRENWGNYKEEFRKRYMDSQGQIDFTKLDFVVSQDEQVKNYILKTDFDLPKGVILSHEEERVALLDFLRKCLIDQPHIIGDPPVYTLFLFLFHNARKLVGDTIFHQNHIRSRRFGGGRAIIYGENGLISTDRQYFYDENLNIATKADP